MPLILLHPLHVLSINVLLLISLKYLISSHYALCHCVIFSIHPLFLQYFLSNMFLSTASFGGEVKPSVPCRRFAACKRSLNLGGSRNLGKNYRTTSSPTVPLLVTRISVVVADVRHLAGKVGMSKSGEKQWQTTPKDLPRVQCATAIPVT